MSRAYTVLDGTIENVGGRIVEDYRDYNCDPAVGRRITEDVKCKLATPLMQSLGFSDNVLTQEVGNISIADSDAMRRIIADLGGIGVWCDYDFNGGYPRDNEAIEYLKMHKDRITESTYEQRSDRDRLMRNMHNTYIATTFIHIRDIGEVRKHFETNTPCEELLGLKPSRFLSRYVEKLVPGITERYALAMSKKHDLTVHLTIDPNIMINCTESATFGSCYSHDGEYHYSSHRYATAQQSMMAVIFDKNGYIMYRNWVLCNDDRTGLINLQHYSSIGGYHIAEETQKVTNAFILQTKEIYNINHSRIEFNLRDPSGSSYLDGWDIISSNPEFIDWNEHGGNPSLGSAYDINDGYETDYACIEAAYCECCDERCSEDETRYIDSYGTVCDCCIDNNFTWSEAEDDYIHENYVATTANGDVYHQDNIGDYNSICSINGEWYHQDDMVEAYDTGNLCYSGNAHYCEELDRHYEDTDAMQEALDEYNQDTEEV